MIVRRPADTTPRLLTVIFPAAIGPATEYQVAQRLRTALGCGITPVIADLTKTPSCDHATMRLLTDAARQAAEHDIELRLAAPALAVRHACTLTGLDRLLSIYCSLDEALSEASTVLSPFGAVVAADDSDRVRRHRPDGPAHVRGAREGRP